MIKSAIFLSVLTIAGAAAASDTSGYWTNATGQVVRDGAGACYHNATWTPEKAIPGCDGIPLSTSSTAADSDHDGVANTADQCPDTPPGVAVDATGCPKRLAQNYLAYLDVKFEFGKHDIQGDARPEIRKVSNFMKQYPSVNVVVEGYTDDTGPADFNQTLSKERADAVIAVLVADGVKPSRLTSAAYGETHPIATNATVEGRRENRRVMAYATAQSSALPKK